MVAVERLSSVSNVVTGGTMGIAQRNEHVSRAEIDHLMAGLQNIIDWLGGAQKIAQKAHDAIEEVGAMRRAQRRGKIALDWREFVSDISGHTHAAALAQLVVDKFEMGRCWLKAPCGITLNQAEFARDWLKRELHERYGTRFYIKISGPAN